MPAAHRVTLCRRVLCEAQVFAHLFGTERQEPPSEPTRAANDPLANWVTVTPCAELTGGLIKHLLWESKIGPLPI